MKNFKTEILIRRIKEIFKEELKKESTLSKSELILIDIILDKSIYIALIEKYE